MKSLPLVLALTALPFALMGCVVGTTSDDTTEADTDTDTDADSDADADADSDSDSDADTDATIPCAAGSYDLYSLPTNAGGDLVVRVDTVLAATTFDPWSALLSSANPKVSPDDVLADGDDEFVCTFPPPEYECPEMTYTSTGGTLGLIVGGYADACNSTNVGTYSLSVTLGGAPITPSLVTNDGTLEWDSGVADSGGARRR
ncbi:MAG: hypothetical protein KC912_24755 [Proteobacteria bacterium]|nr:hypothetical protein [Pseudomonadota bacterium]